MKVDIDDFRVIAHDMANLLTIAGGHYSHLLAEQPDRRDHPNFSKLLSLHERMFEQVSCLQRALEQLNNESVSSIYEGEEILLGDRFKYLRENIEEIGRGYNLQIILDTKACDDSVKVWSNMELARIVSENILRNASQAGAKRVFQSYVDCGDYVEITFRDDGCGMSLEEVRKMGMGHSSTGRGDGTRMIKKMTSSVGGTVEWRSIQNIGTEVICRLKKIKEDGEGQK